MPQLFSTTQCDLEGRGWQVKCHKVLTDNQLFFLKKCFSPSYKHLGNLQCSKKVIFDIFFFFANSVITFMKENFQRSLLCHFAAVILLSTFRTFSRYCLSLFGNFEIFFNKLFEISVGGFCFTHYNHIE